MVVVSQPAFIDHFSQIKTCKPNNTNFSAIPVIDLSGEEAETQIIRACEEFGFFKVINHGVTTESITRLQSEALGFFSLPQSEKDRAGPPDPFGYGSKKIGPNGDVGWVEYLLLTTNPQMSTHKSLSIFQKKPDTFRNAVEDYIAAMKGMACDIVEKMAGGLGIKERNVFSKMLSDEKSDAAFRLNHYPPCPEMQAWSGRNLIGFGEHTDPQLISVLKSNNTSGLQISLKDGSWVSVQPDHNSFFILVGDSLQVMTNGRFRSVKHRVVADSKKSRVSMIYFGGPPLRQKIAPLGSVMGEGEESLYKEFTWEEYKKAAYKSRLADYRLGPFEKKTTVPCSGSHLKRASNQIHPF